MNDYITISRQGVIDEFWRDQIHTGELKRPDGLSLAYMCVTPLDPIGTIVLSSGRVETYLKYQEVIFDLFTKGFQLFAMDHRGQGLSGRTTENPQKGHIGNFGEYIDDLRDFYRQIVEPNAKHKPSLLCHSMGSAIGALYMLEYPQHFEKAVFCAPMFGIRSPVPEKLAQLIALGLGKLNQAYSKEPWYFPGQGNYRETPFADNELTHSESRYLWFTELYREVADIKLGGVTTSWLTAALEAMKTIHHRATELRKPILLLQAGEDSIVDNDAQNRCFEQFANGELVPFPAAKHEILMEVDTIRNKALDRITDFLCPSSTEPSSSVKA